METPASSRQPAVIPPDQGRAYPMGRMRAIFKADQAESAGKYSVSEWWLQPGTRGPGVHQHPEDHVFYVISGTLSVSLNGRWTQAAQGTYILIPGGTPHDFQNQQSVPAGFIAFNSPGGFEARMKGADGIAAALAAEDLRL